MSELLIALLVLIVDWGIRIAAIIVIPRNRKPTAAAAWLLAVFFIPIIGVLLFLLVGSPKLPKKRRAKQELINEAIAAGAGEVPRAVVTTPAWLPGVLHMNETFGAPPMVPGNTAALIDDYQGSIDAIAKAIDQAVTYVHVEYYIIALDDTTRGFFAAMERAVKRGVTVRVLLDHVSSVRTATHRATFKELTRIGVDWHFMLPIQPLKGKWQRPDLRNHRKLVVVDGLVGFMGSQNLIDRSYNKKSNIKRGLQWQELVTRLTGPVVQTMDVIFLSDWFCETDEVLQLFIPVHAPVDGSLECQVVPSGPGYDHENNLRLFLELIHGAQKKVIITSPYFVPDEALMYAITSASERGLDVQLFVSEIGDQSGVYHAQRSYYGQLLRAGVQIWMYPAPYILHSKHLSIDDDVAVIGSSNMDIRSFLLDLEVSLLVRGKSFVNDMRAVEADYRAKGRQLTLEEWNREPLLATTLDGIARLTSSLQ